VRFVQAFAVDMFVMRATDTDTDEGDVGWHQDSLYLRHWTDHVLTAGVAVAEVTGESSPLLYERGSHKLGEVCERRNSG
jgi:ectoine hydroxylase-related dioxygenase (phytanoyl-CoA dioxygenase family)